MAGRSTFEARYGAEARSAALRAAVAELPDAMATALHALRQRVLADRLPLLSLLQADPLEVQFSHLSFQEFFAARATCGRAYKLPASVAEPWRWTAWWANTLRLGSEIGPSFARGLLRLADDGNLFYMAHCSACAASAAAATSAPAACSTHSRPRHVRDRGRACRVQLRTRRRPAARRGAGRARAADASVLELCRVAPSALSARTACREEVVAVSLSLRTNRTLCHVDLSKNALRDDGGQLLVAALTGRTRARSPRCASPRAARQRHCELAGLVRRAPQLSTRSCR